MMDTQQNQQQVNNAHENPKWEREVLEKLVMASVIEQRRTRRWGIFFKMLMFGYLIVIGALMFDSQIEQSISGDEGHTAVVDVIGHIGASESANADSIIEGLRAALKNKKTRGVILNINSPGGSPVQSSYVFSEIRRLKAKHPEIPIYAVVSDICASGGYYIAAAADKIYVSQSSMIGSIGVIINGFGFVEVMEKLGIERRLLIAGEHKALMDPFSAAKQAETRHMQSLLDEVHQQFIVDIRLGRGNRLTDNKDIFSGLIWTGKQGIELGLADDYGSVDSVARKIIGAKNKLNFTPQEKLLDKLSKQLSVSFSQALLNAVSVFSMR